MEEQVCGLGPEATAITGTGVEARPFESERVLACLLALTRVLPPPTRPPCAWWFPHMQHCLALGAKSQPLLPAVSVELEVGSSSSKLQQRPGGQVYSSSANVSVSCLCVRVCMDQPPNATTRCVSASEREVGHHHFHPHLAHLRHHLARCRPRPPSLSTILHHPSPSPPPPTFASTSSTAALTATPQTRYHHNITHPAPPLPPCLHQPSPPRHQPSAECLHHHSHMATTTTTNAAPPPPHHHHDHSVIIIITRVNTTTMTCQRPRGKHSHHYASHHHHQLRKSPTAITTTTQQHHHHHHASSHLAHDHHHHGRHRHLPSLLPPCHPHFHQLHHRGLHRQHCIPP